MKKVTFASLLPVLMASAFSTHAEVGVPVAPEKLSVDGGTIYFTGSVVAAPCAVDNTSDSQKVSLGQITTSQLPSKGATGSAVPFLIKLVGCDLSPQPGSAVGSSNYTKASIQFRGATVDPTTLQVTAGGAGQQPAKNVGIQIMQANKPMTVDGSDSTALQNIYPGANEMPFTATYVATDNSVTAGTANGSVNFTVNYQ